MVLWKLMVPSQLLQRDPSVRMTGARIKKHPYFGMIDWDQYGDFSVLSPSS